MICPHCQKNTISFFKVWLKSIGWFRTLTCPECNKKSKMKRNIFLFIVSFCLGVGVLVPLFLKSWGIFILALVAVVYLIIDAAIDYKYRKLVPVD
jgi:hypothetical protein